MTSPPESGPRPPVTEPPHEPSIGEEIRHEIEEVVEHVPRPIRWTVGKLIRITLLAIVTLIALTITTAVLYVANRTEWAAKELTLIVNQALVSRSDVVLEIGDLKGNPLTGVRVLRPRVRFREGDAPPLLEAPEMRLRYSAWALATGSRGPIVIELDRPQLQLGRKSDGSLRLPSWNHGAPNPRARKLDFIVRIRDGALLTPDTALTIAGLHGEALATTGGGTRVELRSLRWREGPFGSRLERAAGTYSTGDSTRFVVRELRTGDLDLTAHGAWKADETPRIAVTHASVRRVRWSWLARVFRNGTFDVPGEGRIAVDARGWKTWAGRFGITADWDSLALEAQGGLAWDGERLRLDPLNGTSAAGDLRGAVLWSKQGWEVGGEARDADPAHWEVMGLRNWPEGRLNGRFRYAVDTRAIPHARLSARLSSSEWSGWRADSGTVAIDFTPVGPDSFVVRAIRRGGEMTLRAATQPTGWRGAYRISRFPLDEWPDGRASGLKGTLASGEGIAEGRNGALLVEGALDGVNTDWLGIRTRHWRLTGMKGRLLPKPDLTANARLTDFMFLAVHWDTAAVAFQLGDGTVALPGLTAAAGDTVLRLDAGVVWGPAGWQLTAERAELASRQFHWTAEPPLRLAGDRDGVRFERLIARDGDARLEMEGRWAAPVAGARYEWTARAAALDLGRLGLPAEWGLAGTGEAMLRVTGVNGDPRWNFVGTARRPGSRGHRADSLRLAMSGAPGRLEIAEARALLDDGWLGARGEVTAMRRAWPDTLTGDGVLRWIAGAGRWSGTVRSDRMPLDRLGNLARGASGWRGRVDGTLEVRGSPREPDLAWNFDAQPLVWRDFRVDAASGRGSYRSGRLEVPELRMTKGGVAGVVRGSMPLDLALGRKPSVPDTPMDWRVDLPGGDLALLPAFVPQIGFASGRLDVDARLTGTAKRPDLAGRVSVRDGRLRMAGREEMLEAVRADLTLDETRIALDSLTARQTQRRGVTGHARASGAVELEGLTMRRYRFDVGLRDFTALETGTYVAAFDGNFVVTNGPRVGTATLPLVRGTAELDRAEVLFDFANQSQLEQVAAATKPLYWVYSIQLNATDNLFWRPPDADIEFSAALELEQMARDSLRIFGDMSALRGTYYYLNNRFTIRRADLDFDHAMGAVDPRLDIEAVTTVPRSMLIPVGSGGVGGGSGQTGNEQIVVTITGRSRQPVMTFTTESGHDQPTVLQALTYGPLISNPRVGVATDFADNYFTRALNRQLSADVQRAFQGWVSDVEVARETGGLVRGQGDLIVRVGIPVSSRATVRYGQAIAGTGTRRTTSGTTTDPLERDIQAEYRINRFFYFTTEMVQRRDTASPNAALNRPEFNVNLKARWEY